MEGSTKFKTKRMAKQRRHTSSENRASDFESDALLPHALRSRLYNLFGQIEREFEHLYAENLSMQEKLEMLNDRLDQVTGEKGIETEEGVDGAQSIKQSVKKSGSQISQKLKLTYKTSTSKIVSSFRTSTSASQVVRDFRGHRDGVWEVTVSRTEPRVIATASADHTSRVWWVPTGTCLLQYTGHAGSVNSVRFHPTLDVVVTASGDQTCHIWKANISAPQHVENLKTLSLGEDDLDSDREDLEGIDSSDDKHEPTFVHQAMVELHGHSGVVIAADWMAGGTQVISASWDRTANLFDAETGELITTLTGHDQELTNIAAHTSQKLAVTTSKDTTFRLWDFRDPSMKVNVFQGHTQHVTSAVFAGGDKVISGSDDRTVKVWDLKNMRSPLTTIRTDSAVNRLSVSINQNVMAIPHDNRHIRLYDLNGIRIGRLPSNKRQGHSRMVCATAWAEDFSETSVVNLFSCGFDRHVFGWHINLLPKE